MLGLITQREIINQYKTSCDQLEKEYVTFFNSLGIELCPVSNFQEANLKGADLLILTGGGSINKEQPNRDRLEKELFEQAIGKYGNKSIPVIGICRGMQYINILLGGKIDENAELKVKRPNCVDHNVKVGNEVIKVNNYHNDVIYVSNLADGLTVLAKDVENDTVEAFYKSGILGIQWHPERSFENKKSEEYSINLIRDFIINKGRI
jgi:putative glutamine amidotransferase